MKRILLIGASLALGIFAAGQLPAKEPQPRQNHPRGPGAQSSMNFNKNLGGSVKTSPGFSGGSIKKFDGGNFQQNFKPMNKPFKPMGPITGKPVTKPFDPIKVGGGFPNNNPIVNKPIVKPLGPIKVHPGFPIKPIKGNDPIVKPFPHKPFPHKPGKPIDHPIAKPWPIKPIHQPHHHHHCEPHWYKPCYSWLWYGTGSSGCYVVSKPIVIQQPIYVNQIEQLPEVYVGSTITLPAQALGDQMGVVMLRINDISMGAMVNEWTNNGVQVTLPMLGLEQPKRAEIVVLLPDGQVAMSLPVTLLPAVPPQQQ